MLLRRTVASKNRISGRISVSLIAGLRLICAVMAETLVSTLAATAEPAGRSGPPREEPRLAQPPPSFEQLVADHQQRVARLCYRLLGWRQDVDDVAQEVFLAAFRAMAEYRGESSMSTWLTRIAVNACRSHVRKRVRLLRLLGGARHSREPHPGRSADHKLMDRERFARVRAAIRKLPPKYREVVVLRYLEEMAVPEVSDVLGLSRNAVEVRLNRARKRLGDDLAGIQER